MSQNEKALDAKEMRRLLDRLADVLSDRHQAVAIYMVGGANIALSINSSRVTKDIDVVAKQGRFELESAAAEVARTEPGLGPDWINAEFTGPHDANGGMTWSWFDNKDCDTPTTLFSSEALTVELASPEMMLALKTIAGRDQDISDTYDLMRATDIYTPKALDENLTRFTGERIWRAQGTLDSPIHLDPQFHRVFDGLPDDLLRHQIEHTDDRKERGRLEARLAAQTRGDRREERCTHAVARVRTENGIEVSRETLRCRRKAGHRGRHWMKKWTP